MSVAWVLRGCTQIKKGNVGNEKDGEIAVWTASSAAVRKGGIQGCACDLGAHGAWMCLSRQYLLMMEM